MREETLARQIKLGVVPAGTSSHRSRKRSRTGTRLPPTRKSYLRARWRVFAGFGEYADTEIGRLIDAIGDTGQLDNTLIFYIVGDNGTSAEGGMSGLYNEMTYFNGQREAVADILKHYDQPR
jgi:arylsulfatase